jgi:TolA-binding protein
MRLFVVLACLGSTGCVIDRMGQSAVSSWQDELALQKVEIGEFERRLAILETSLRVRGRQEAEKMEDLGGVRAEVRRLRGELELARHGLQGLEEITGVLRDESNIRLDDLGERVSELETLLGVDLVHAAVSNDPAVVAQDSSASDAGLEMSEAASPDTLLVLAQDHLAAGRALAARSVLRRYVQEFPQSPRIIEARFMLAETFFAEAAYRQAVLSYEEIVELAPNSDWAPRAMLRQGECFLGLGLTDEALLFWEDLLGKYPESQEAQRARERLDNR